MAGAANGAADRPGGARQCATLAKALSAEAPAIFASCLIDQFGNKYEFTIDKDHKYVYGTVTNVQCGDTWPLSGSYVKKAGFFQLELTAANPNDGDACVPIYKLKGAYPNAAWYYVTGYGDQEFTYTVCAHPGKPLRVEHGGARP